MSEQEKIRSVVVTVVLTPNEGGGLDTQHALVVNGRPMENSFIGLALGGPLNIVTSAGRQNTTHSLVLARSLSNLSNWLSDEVMGLLMGAAERAAQPVGVTPSTLPEDVVEGFGAGDE